MRKLITFITITLFCAAGVVSPISVAAHELLTSNSMGVTLHIEPEDDPIVGTQSTVFMEFKDLQDKFSLVNCRCQAFIMQGDNELFFETLVPANAASPLSSSFRFKFPAKGSYELIIQGDPVQAGAFESFKVQETIDVEREAEASDLTAKPNAVENKAPYLVSVVIILGFLVGGTIVVAKRSRKQ